MKRLLCSLLLISVGCIFSKVSSQEIEYWGFTTATNGTTMYVSSAFKFTIEDAQLGFPNTKVIRTWRLTVKSELGDYYNESDFKLKHETMECNRGIRYRSRLEAEEGRQCFIDKLKSNGRSVKTIYFTYL